MGIVLSCCTALACSCCFGLSCQCLGYGMTVTKSIATRVVYTITFLSLSILAWVMSFYAYDVLSWIPYINNSCEETTCGTFTVYRISFSLFVYHMLLSLFLIGVSNTKDIRAKLNDGWWPLKIPFLLLLVVAAFFIPNIFFTYYAWGAIIGAGFFILVQLVLLVDFAYSWSESWVDKWQGNGLEENENKSYLYALLACTGFLFLLSAGFDVFMYSLFCRGDCWWNALVITGILLMCIALSVCSVIPQVQEYNPRAGLLQASIFTVYCTYYTYSAILSEPTCGSLPFDWSTGSTTTADWLSLIFGGMFTIISVVYASLRVGHAGNNSNESPELLAEEKGEELDEEDMDLDDEKEMTSYSYSLFHLAFALGAMYIGMLLTNWSVITGETDTAETDSGWVSVSVKLASCVFAGVLYTWTVFAPLILPNRDWDV